MNPQSRKITILSRILIQLALEVIPYEIAYPVVQTPQNILVLYSNAFFLLKKEIKEEQIKNLLRDII